MFSRIYSPWIVEWSDGALQTNIQSSPVTHTISPSGSTLLTVVEVSDTFATGTSIGSVDVIVNPFSVTTSPVSSIALGWDPEVLEAIESYGIGTISIQWSILSGPNVGYLFGPGENPVTLDGSPHPVSEETIDYQVEVSDSSTRTTFLETVRILVALNPYYFDVNQDQRNNLLDLWALCPEWLHAYPNLDDPNGDG